MRVSTCCAAPERGSRFFLMVMAVTLSCWAEAVCLLEGGWAKSQKPSTGLPGWSDKVFFFTTAVVV